MTLDDLRADLERVAGERDLAKEERDRAKACIRTLIRVEREMHHGNVEAAEYAAAWAEAARIVVT